MSGSKKPLRGNGKTTPTRLQVVAEIHISGASNGNTCVFGVIATTAGLFLSPASKMDEPGRWVKVPTLQDAVKTLPHGGNLRVLARSMPDVRGSDFDANFPNRRTFEESEFDFRCTGASHVAVVTLPHPHAVVHQQSEAIQLAVG